MLFNWVPEYQLDANTLISYCNFVQPDIRFLNVPQNVLFTPNAGQSEFIIQDSSNLNCLPSTNAAQGQPACYVQNSNDIGIYPQLTNDRSSENAVEQLSLQNPMQQPITMTTFKDAFCSEDGFERLKRCLKQSNDYCRKVSDVLQERSTLEQKYSKELSGLSIKLQRLSKDFIGSISQAFHALALEMDTEAETHRRFSNSLMEDLVRPIRNVIDAQSKVRKSVEASIEKAIRNWQEKRNSDLKCRIRYWQTVDSLENSYIKLDASLLNGQSPPSKATSTKTENTARKLEEQLQKAENKYLSIIEEVECARQDMDLELCRGCNELHRLEEEKLTEMQDSMKKLSACFDVLNTKTNETCRALKDLRMDVKSDLRELCTRYGNSSLQEPEILLLDITAEDLRNRMSKERRQMMLRNWIAKMEMCKHHQLKSFEGLQNLMHFCTDHEKFSLKGNEVKIKAISLQLLHVLYEASLYKFQSAYNAMTNKNVKLDQGDFQLVHTFDKSGVPLSFAKLPYVYSIPSVFPDVSHRISPSDVSFPTQRTETNLKNPIIGWKIPNLGLKDDSSGTLSANRLFMRANGLLCDSDFSDCSSPLCKCVVQYPYTAKRNDELTIVPGDVITVYEKRADSWWRGVLRQSMGLFPSTYVQELKA